MMTEMTQIAAGLDQIRAYVGQSALATVRLTALGLALQARISGKALPGRLHEAVREVLEEAGLVQAMQAADPEALTPVLALIRAELLLGGHILTDGADMEGWQDRGAELLQAFGTVSLGFWRNVERLAPPDLRTRLETEGARFLDIGTGVGWLCVGMLRRWPALTAVGLEPLGGALELARDNLARAGQAGRVELRQGRGEDLGDQAAFDLIFVPSAFIGIAALPAILARSLVALRPGGWLMLAALAPDAGQMAVTQFRAAVWGGHVLGLPGAADLLREAGFADIRPHAPENGIVGFVLAQG
jgi:precorrin-6B methylase 2